MRAKLRPLLLPLLSVVLGLLLAAMILRLFGYDVQAAFGALWSGATGLQSGPVRAANDIPLRLGFWEGHLSLFVLAQSLAKATPLMLAGLSVAVALRAGLFNIGAPGQILMGALCAALMGALGKGGYGTSGWSPFWQLPLTLLAGMAGGALWGAIPGLLKAWRGVQEVLTTIMLNYIAINFADYLVTHNLKDPNPKNMAEQTALMAKSAWLAPLIPGSNLTLGFVLALLMAVWIAFLFRRTAFGYEIRAVGLGARAAQAMGISVPRTLVLTMLLSGTLAGLAGAIEVMGVHHRFVQGVQGTYGFDGIAVALLGGLDGYGVAVSALFFGFLANGAVGMQAQTDVPDAIAQIVQAVIIVLIGVRVWRSRKTTTPVESDEEVRADARA
jgi:simple sugar transport system permease protein